MTPSEELRAAAERLRELAYAAHGSPWAAVEIPRPGYDLPAWWVESEHQDLDGSTSATVADCPWGEADARYIASMHPGVGTALAAWLEAAARDYEAGVTAADDVFRDDPAGRDRFLATGPGAPSPHALTVARQILGSTS
ncbi:hypothetical protein [Streptomyces sp. CBG31]|uniref:hypothetical protein n=1 Tax=Streptomyces sp. CBG31 TaxID=2762623 RepID=UPI001EFE7D92|nr:hypothetical protein [Streptomyces sp. CBG31]